MSIARKLLMSSALVACGFVAGHARTPEPQFVLALDAPAGESSVRCISGCELLGGRDLGNPAAGRMAEYRYSCSGTGTTRCAARVAGWLTGKAADSAVGVD